MQIPCRLALSLPKPLTKADVTLARVMSSCSDPGSRIPDPATEVSMARTLAPASTRRISWSHFELDEWGALNDWLAIAPRAQAACSQVGALVNAEDFALFPPSSLTGTRQTVA
jgi:hypothetical protein